MPRKKSPLPPTEATAPLSAPVPENSQNRENSGRTAPEGGFDLTKIDPEVYAVMREQALAVSAMGDDPRAVFDFGELVFGVVPAQHHRQWIEAFFANPRTAHVSPPESAKTTWGAIVCAWWIGKHPETTSLVSSNGEDVAADIAQLIANTIEFNPKWKLVFPNVIPDKTRGWSRDGYEVRDTSKTDAEWAALTATKKDPTLVFGGVGSASINGRRVTGVLIGDDLHDRKSKNSEAECRRVVEFVQDTLLRRATSTARVWFNQTRWNPNDYLGWLSTLEGAYAFHVFTHPALNEAGESYWPAQWPVERLLTEKSGMTGPDWSLIFQGDATAAKGTVLKLEALRWFPHLNIKPECPRYLGVDMALKLQELSQADERKHSEFSISVIADTGAGLVLEDGYAGLLYFGEAENTFFQYCDIHRPARVGFEVNAQNRLYYNNFMRRRLEQGYHWLQVVPLTTTQNMMARMSEMEPDFRNGWIQVSDRPLPFLSKFRDQWVSFGQKGVKNDTLSSTHLARQVAYHRLPSESAEQRERRKNAPPAVSVYQRIERAYQ